MRNVRVKCLNVPKMIMLWGLTAAMLLWIAAASAQPENDSGKDKQSATQAEFALNAYLAEQPSFVLPFHLVNGHILIDGAVNGRRGKFLFDTGTEFPFFLNNHYLPLAKDQFIAKGHAGSGQEMVLYRQAKPIADIDLAGQVHFTNAGGVLHTNWKFLEEGYGIPAFLGSIGHGFNQNYLFVIDYDVQTITFHSLAQDEKALAGAFDPARVVMTVPFTAAGVDGKMPEIEVSVGGQTITASFDTGNAGSLELTERMKSTLQQQGNLTLTASEYAYGTRAPHVRGALTGASYGTQALPKMYPLNFTTGSHNRLGLGYHFLKNYISVWDFKHRTITLLKPA